MDVNLIKHENELKTAWKDIVSDKCSNDWLILGYDGKSYDLNVVGTGCGGLEELAANLSVSKILYALCKVIDPNTQLNKHLLINWQGESVPFTMRGACANHFESIKRFFPGIHITIHARNEDDVEPETILDQLSKTTATRLNLKERSEVVENIAPVGTNYKRVQPQREINLNERENFWVKQQEEEKRRKAEDRVRVEEQRRRTELEAQERESKDAQMREMLIQRKETELQKRREAEKNAENVARNELCERLRLSSSGDDNENDLNEVTEVKEQRVDEIKALTKGSVMSARALFESNTSYGQLNKIKSNVNTNVKPVPEKKCVNVESNANGTAIGGKTQSLPSKTEPVDNKPLTSNVSSTPSVKQNAPDIVAEVERNVDEIASQPTPAAPKAADVPSVPQEEEEVDEDENENEEDAFDERVYDIHQVNDVINSLHYNTKFSEPLEDIAEEVEEGDGEPVAPSGQPQQEEMSLSEQVFRALDEGLTARALYDYQAADDTEISFDPDDIITHIEQIDEGWWQGMGPDGTYGLFPANYVELIN